MKKSIRLLTVLCLLTAFLLFAVSCTEQEDANQPSNGIQQNIEEPGETGNKTNDLTIEYKNVTFANTAIDKLKVEKGKSISKPSDPTKAGCIFGGWFYDSVFQSKVQFPLTVNEDITIYAQFFDYQDAFKKARNNTIGENVPGFEYAYTLDINATYSLVQLKGKTVGTAQYSNAGEVNFYDEHTNSGILFYDGSKYLIRRGTTLQHVSLDENDKLKSYSVEEVDADYKYDSSSFAKAVFTYSDEQLKTISPTEQKNVYKLKTALNASTVISLIGNNINNPMVVKIIGELPDTAVDTGMYVTFSDGKISSYKYEMKISVTSLELSLVYNLTFTDSGTAKTIVPKTFSGVALTPEEIANQKKDATAFIEAFRSKSQSGYDFEVKTGVDYGITSSEINSTFKGSAFRKIEGKEVFFHNDIEIDSDYKNKDLYKSAGIDDVHVKQTKLSNGDVYLIEKKLLQDNTTQITDFTPSENTSYYLFDVLSHSGEYSFAEKTVKDGVTSYSFGLTCTGVSALLHWFDTVLDLDPLSKATVDVDIFGDFDDSSISLSTGKLVVNIKGGVLDEIQIKIDGNTTTSFADSTDYSASKKAQIKLDYSLTVNSDGDSFVPYDTVKAAK